MNKEEAIAILNTNVGEVVAKLADISDPADLQLLLDTELASESPRKGVLKNLEALLNQTDALVAKAPQVSAKEIEAEIEKLEALPLCVRTAGRLDALRDQLEDLKK